MESTVPPLVALLSLDKDAKLPGVLQPEELNRRQHVGAVEQYCCQKFHNNYCLPCPWRIAKSRGDWGLKETIAVW